MAYSSWWILHSWRYDTAGCNDDDGDTNAVVVASSKW